MFNFCKEHNQWETHNVNVLEIDGVTWNNPMSISREVRKVVVKSSNEGKNPKYDKGK